MFSLFLFYLKIPTSWVVYTNCITVENFIKIIKVTTVSDIVKSTIGKGMYNSYITVI